MSNDGFDRLADRTESYLDRKAGQLADHPWLTAIKWLLIVLVLALVFSGIGWLSGWFGEAKQVTGPANVSTQYAGVIQDWQDMISATQNACSAQQAAKSDSDPTLVEDPSVAYAATYRRIRSDFNRRQQNIFEAEKVGPRGYPRVVEPFAQESENPPDWCGVTRQLEKLHN